MIQDVVDGIKTPTPPLPDFTDPSVRKKEFESLNKGYYYTEHVYELLKNLETQIYDEL